MHRYVNNGHRDMLFYCGKLENRVLKTGPGQGSWLDRAHDLQHQEDTLALTTADGEYSHPPRMGWWVGVLATSIADDTGSWAEVLSELAWIRFTQTQGRVSLDALK